MTLTLKKPDPSRMYLTQRPGLSLSVFTFLSLASFFNQSSHAASILTGNTGAGVSTDPSLKIPAITLGGEYTFTLSSAFELGGGLENTFLRYENGMNGSLRFYHAVVRFHLPQLQPLFLDAKVGLAQGNFNYTSSGLKPAAGAGIGYRIPVSEKVDISPRVGVRYLPNPEGGFNTSQAGAMLDAGVMVSLHF